MKILILYTAVGQGHKTMAENLAASLAAAGHEVGLADAYKAQDGKLIRVGAKIHRFMNVQAPWLWRFFYTNKPFTDTSLRFRQNVAAKNHSQILKLLNGSRPDLIIATQAAPSGVVAYLKSEGLYRGLFGIAFCDYHLHRYWLYSSADFYLANIEEQKKEMISLGVPAEKIFVTGFNLRPLPNIGAEKVRAKLGIAPGKKVVLLTSGSLGLGINKKLVARLSAEGSWHIVVVCGKNEAAVKELKSRYSRPNVSVFGFYEPMDELYAIADIFLTKPGGLSVAEALRYKLPIVITSMLPGQEEWNLRYLRGHNLVMPESGDVIAQIRGELSSGQFREQLRRNPAVLAILGAPDAANCLKSVLAGSR